MGNTAILRGSWGATLRQAWVVEGLLTLLVLVLLAWQAMAFYREDFRQDTATRYAADQEREIQLPRAAPALATICATAYQEPTPPTAAKNTVANAPASWQELLCGDSKLSKSSTAVASDNSARLQQWLQEVQHHLSNRLFSQTSSQAEKAKAALPLARAGLDMPAPEDREQEDDLAFYRQTYGIKNINTPEAPIWQSQPVACAATWLSAAQTTLGKNDTQLLMAAMLAGKKAVIQRWDKSETRALPGLASLANLQTGGESCAEIGDLKQALNQATTLLQQAYKSPDVAAKAELAQPLPQRAILFFTAYAVLAWSLLQIGRRALAHPERFLALAIALWAGLGWATQVPAPFSWSVSLRHGFFPAVFACAMLVFVILRGGWQIKLAPLPAQTLNSRLAFPGVVLLLGLGWLLLLDLCVHGHPRNRFLALEQQRNLFVCFIFLSLLPTFRFHVLGGLLNLYSRRLQLINANNNIVQWLPWLLSAITVIGLGLGLHHYRQMTSEIFRVLFVFSFAFLLFLRGESLLKTRDKSLFLYFLKPFVLFLVLFAAGQIITDDQGPLLVTLYGGVIIAGGMLATWLYYDGRAWGRSLLISTLMVVAVLGLATWAVFTLGQYHDTTRIRIESALNPYASANDQMAILHYFRESIPRFGYGLGDVPWCGNESHSACSGMPLQTQSDYIFTAIQGIWGLGGALALLGFIVLWLRHLILYHPKITEGRYQPGQRLASLQAWASWLALCWFVLTLTQLSVTVAGNLGWLPLTGITFPFMSFGVWSLLSNAFFLGLNLNLLPREQA